MIRYVEWQVLESGQRHGLPDWMVWNQDTLLLEGVATEADVGNDYVIMVCPVRYFFLIFHRVSVWNVEKQVRVFRTVAFRNINLNSVKPTMDLELLGNAL